MASVKDPYMSGTSEEEIRDQIRAKLSRMEDEILLTLDAFKDNLGVDPRWLATGRTDIQKGFMCVKRAIYEGKRVGD
jgi:hypothetical protein